MSLFHSQEGRRVGSDLGLGRVGTEGPTVSSTRSSRTTSRREIPRPLPTSVPQRSGLGVTMFVGSSPPTTPFEDRWPRSPRTVTFSIEITSSTRNLFYTHTYVKSSVLDPLDIQDVTSLTTHSCSIGPSFWERRTLQKDCRGGCFVLTVDYFSL